MRHPLFAHHSGETSPGWVGWGGFGLRDWLAGGASVQLKPARTCTAPLPHPARPFGNQICATVKKMPRCPGRPGNAGGGGPLRPPDVASALLPVWAAGQSTPQTSPPWVTPEVVTALLGNQLATRGHCHCPPGEDSESPSGRGQPGCVTADGGGARAGESGEMPWRKQAGLAAPCASVRGGSGRPARRPASPRHPGHLPQGCHQPRLSPEG